MAGERRQGLRLRTPARTEFLGPALILWASVLIGLLSLALAARVLTRLPGLTEFFLQSQDLMVAGAMLWLTSALLLTPALPAALAPRPIGWRGAGLIALGVTAFAWAGTHLVYDGYALSLDEFMADFDARIFAAGHWVGRIPPELRDYAKALQPQFVLISPDHGAWISGYEPMNALLRTVGRLAGAEGLVSPLLAGVGIAATYGVARRLWPERPQAAGVAAVLLATSSQVLVTAMTPYAMTAHLAFNMAWLWLFLRGGRLGHGLAPIPAFVATGLHQIVFHPLFAAPFVLELWLERRWKAAAWHTLAYAAIGAFWVLYPGQLARHMAQGGGAQAQALVQVVDIGGRIAGMVSAFNANAFGLMADNLIRLFTWQSLLTLPLALVAIPAALRAKGMLRAMVVGLALTTAAMLVLLAYQGHGWGYRYLHGLLGTLCLLAAWGWMRLTQDAGAERQRTASAVFAVAAAISLAVLLPIRLWQAHSFLHPYAVAERAIQASPADLVLVDGAAMWFGDDLVRNDPFLTNRPLVMERGMLKPEQVKALCGRYRVAEFGAAEGKAAGIRLTKPGAPGHTHSSCGD